MGFKHELSQAIQVTVSGETGHVKGRAEYTTMNNQYYIHYLAADGRGADGWFGEDELSPAKEDGLVKE
ncbi:hypothetical protein [Trabulsiella odontotermitis]|uniref:Uncharacterized protein n=1 Tax=Trabulsiella odontotermitis TaxID=379893 RepID=A0A0L0GX51_9ENTR|nr:hypothetical protein [Trabulsiella odontotermitis]KNC93755.1 hypothetical protein GM31_18160 [Trabulsiella odontotermitis]